jgi:hypothetical protein
MMLITSGGTEEMHSPMRDTPTHDTYKYVGLPSGKWMRLLRLFPGTGDDPINFELFTTELNSAPPYEAISYAWGDYHDRQDVICCGHTANITKSLFTGLKRFRYPGGPRILWADAICIDQSNDEEKGHQVNMMGNVYDRAFRVLVWLGEASNHAGEKAVHLIHKINKYIDSRIVEDELAINPLVALVNVPRLKERDQLFQNDFESEALRTFFDCPWFSRVWVLQEVALASSAEVFYGATFIALSEAVQAAFILAWRSDLQNGFRVGRLGNALTDILSTFGKKETWIEERTLLRHVRGFMELNARVTLIQVIGSAARFQATDPRDYVYAFLGHPAAKRNDGTSCILEADYKLSIEDTFKQLVQSLYDRDRRLDFLTVVFHLYPVDIDRSPSWLPGLHMDHKGHRINHPEWNADDSTQTRDLVKVDFRNDMLHGSGLIFDSIAACSENFKWQTFKTMTPNPVESCWKVQADSTTSAYADTRLQAFCWTLVAGTYYGGIDRLQLGFQSYCHQKSSSAFCATVQLANIFPEHISSVEGDWMQFENEAYLQMQGRKFFVTKGGFFGLGPSLLQDGDLCCILLGCRMPLIIRPAPSTSYFKLLEASYIHGIMHGEVVKARLTSNSQFDEITLV